MTLPLFDPAPAFDKAGLTERLRSLASENIWIGTSSWKYPGWLDQIYSRDRYTTRGKFSQKRFEAECLAEYADTFPIVCGDFSFYQFPSPEFWQRLFAAAPAGLRFALKAPEEVTAEVFPRHARYGPRAGLKNPSFLKRRCIRRGLSGASRAVSRPHRFADLRIWCAVHSATRICRPAGAVPGRPAAVIPLFGRSTQSRLSDPFVFRVSRREASGPRVQRMDQNASAGRTHCDSGRLHR